jgi:hypothetical protein
MSYLRLIVAGMMLAACGDKEAGPKNNKEEVPQAVDDGTGFVEENSLCDAEIGQLRCTSETRIASCMQTTSCPEDDTDGVCNTWQGVDCPDAHLCGPNPEQEGQFKCIADPTAVREIDFVQAINLAFSDTDVFNSVRVTSQNQDSSRMFQVIHDHGVAGEQEFIDARRDTNATMPVRVWFTKDRDTDTPTQYFAVAGTITLPDAVELGQNYGAFSLKDVLFSQIIFDAQGNFQAWGSEEVKVTAMSFQVNRRPVSRYPCFYLNMAVNESICGSNALANQVIQCTPGDWDGWNDDYGQLLVSENCNELSATCEQTEDEAGVDIAMCIEDETGRPTSAEWNAGYEAGYAAGYADGVAASDPDAADSSDTTDDSSDTTDGSSDTTDGGSDTTDGSSDTTDGSSDTSDGGSDTTDGSSDTSDGGSDTTDGSSDTTDGGSATESDEPASSDAS